MCKWIDNDIVFHDQIPACIAEQYSMIGQHVVENITENGDARGGVITIYSHVHPVLIAAMIKEVVTDQMSSVAWIPADIPRGSII